MVTEPLLSKLIYVGYNIYHTEKWVQSLFTHEDTKSQRGCLR